MRKYERGERKAVRERESEKQRVRQTDLDRYLLGLAPGS